MRVFIAGAKDIRTLDVNAKKRIESIRSKEYDILVGDCYGVDSAVQKLCADASYQLRRKTPAFRHGDIRRRKRDRFTNLHCRKIVNVV